MLKEARQALNELKGWTRKDSWIPVYPEYFHTEAFLEYQEYLLGKLTNLKRESLKSKLEHAYREISAAVELFPTKETYNKLKELIELELATFSVEEG